jgi:flagellar FliL protein
MAPKAQAAVADDIESEDVEAAAPEQAKKKFAFKLPSLKILLIGVGALTVVAGGGGAAFYFLRSHAPPEPKEAAAPVGKPVVFVDLPEVLVNLSSVGNERTQYLKAKIVLELPEQTMIQQIQPIMPRVMDAFQTYLRELRPSDLDGSAGLYRLKEELTRRVNASIAPSRINAVLFKEIVVQ